MPIAWYAIGRALASSDALRVVTLDPDPDERSTKFRERDPDLLRVGTYNIAHGRGNGAENWNGESAATRGDRLDRIAEFLTALDLDVVVLNEVDFDATWSHRVNQAAFLAEKCGYKYRIEQRNFDVSLPFYRWACGNAVLSRYPIQDARWIDLPGDAAWESALGGKKDACVCTLEAHNGTLVRVVPVHLSSRSEEVRTASVEALKGVADQGGPPLLLVGDFNSSPQGFPLTDPDKPSAVGMLTQDPRWHTLPEKVTSDADCTFSSTEPKQVIDWIFVPRPWQLVSRQVYPIDLSDHRPVLGVVRMTDREPGTAGLAPFDQ
ncbi:MAG: endonuclease/exonuclease/phosphatase family protein [Planctomycetaceae bacterium]|nr:endonuclease/exonuclease/phosphatase family protein [Planctomycetaceae bacterium]